MGSVPMARADLLIVLLIVVGLVAFGLLAFLSARERAIRIAQIAARLGLRYQADVRFDRGLRNFEAMSPGNQPRIRNEIAGTYKGRDVRAFDFRYTVQQGKSQSTRTRGVVLASVPVAWPRVRIVPEHFGHKIAHAFGLEEVDFESQEFSDRFWVEASDRRFAYDLIDARMMEFLLAAPHSRWELQEGLLCAYEEGAWKPEEFVGALDAVVAILDCVPRLVWARGEGAP